MPAEDLDPQPLRVLLVEDNPDDAFLLERHLRRNGFAPAITRVETAGEMASALQAEDLPDIILADYNLPHFSGPAALHLLRTTAFDIPFIMLSGAISEEMAVESMRAGAHDYVTKQNLARLVPALERELKEASARRKRLVAEQALRASEARFHRLVEAMPLGFTICDASGRISYANVAIERLLGYAPGEITAGHVLLSAICPAVSNLNPNHLTTEPFDAVCVTTSGQTVDVLLGVAILNPEQPAHLRQTAAFVADLTLQKQSEEALRRTEKLAVAGRFAASIAHEINNPLEAITNCLYLISQTDLTPDGRNYLDLAQKELVRVAQITMQTLRFYRRSTRPAVADIHDLIDTVLTIFEARLRRAQIEIVRDLRPIPAVFAHDGEIRQVLANLIGNAMDALPEGGRIVLRTAPATLSGSAGVTVTVADNGVGMDPSTLKRIFEPFFSTKGITGTGLGLWISQEIVHRHNGSMRVRSCPARAGSRNGTVFRIFIPAGDSPPSAPAHPHLSEHEQSR